MQVLPGPIERQFRRNALVQVAVAVKGSFNLTHFLQSPRQIEFCAHGVPMVLSNATPADRDDLFVKTDGLTTVYQGGPVSYTITVTNQTAAYAVTATVTDSVPATVTGVTWTCVASAGSSCTAASGSGNAISTSATLLPNGTATYTVSRITAQEQFDAFEPVNRTDEFFVKLGFHF